MQLRSLRGAPLPFGPACQDVAEVLESPAASTVAQCSKRVRRKEVLVASMNLF